MKKILIAILLILCLFPAFNTQSTQAESVEDSFVVTGNFATVFEAPDFSSKKLFTIRHNSEVKIELENSIPKEYESGSYVFYKVLQYENIDGYVFADLLTQKLDVITAIPNFNAQTNSKCKVFFLEDNNFVESEITLENDQRIFLYQGFDSKKEYNAIAFVNNNQVLYGYLKTNTIDPDGINPIIITCICIIIAILGIIFAWLFMKSKKIKWKKSKNTSKKQ